MKQADRRVRPTPSLRSRAAIIALTGSSAALLLAFGNFSTAATPSPAAPLTVVGSGVTWAFPSENYRLTVPIGALGGLDVVSPEVNAEEYRQRSTLKNQYGDEVYVKDAPVTSSYTINQNGREVMRRTYPGSNRHSWEEIAANLEPGVYTVKASMIGKGKNAFAYRTNGRGVKLETPQLTVNVRGRSKQVAIRFNLSIADVTAGLPLDIMTYDGDGDKELVMNLAKPVGYSKINVGGNEVWKTTRIPLKAGMNGGYVVYATVPNSAKQFSNAVTIKLKLGGKPFYVPVQDGQDNRSPNNIDGERLQMINVSIADQFGEGVPGANAEITTIAAGGREVQLRLPAGYAPSKTAFQRGAGVELNPSLVRVNSSLATVNFTARRFGSMATISTGVTACGKTAPSVAEFSAFGKKYNTSAEIFLTPDRYALDPQNPSLSPVNFTVEDNKPVTVALNARANLTLEVAPVSVTGVGAKNTVQVRVTSDSSTPVPFTAVLKFPSMTSSRAPTVSGTVSSGKPFTADVPFEAVSTGTGGIEATLEGCTDLSIAPLEVKTGGQLELVSGYTPAAARPGEAVTYSVKVTNTGGVPLGGITLSSGADAPTDSPALAQTLDLAAGASQIITRAGVLKQANGALSRSITATAEEQRVSSSADLGVIPVADLQVASSSDATQFKANTSVLIRTLVTNAGPSIASNSLVTLNLPSGVELLSSDASCKASSDTLICTLGELPSGETRTIVTQYRVADATQAAYSLGGRVSSQTEDPNLANNGATVNLTAMPEPVAPVVAVTPPAPTVIDIPAPPAPVPAPVEVVVKPSPLGLVWSDVPLTVLPGERLTVCATLTNPNATAGEYSVTLSSNLFSLETTRFDGRIDASSAINTCSAVTVQPGQAGTGTLTAALSSDSANASESKTVSRVLMPVALELDETRPRPGDLLQATATITNPLPRRVTVQLVGSVASESLTLEANATQRLAASITALAGPQTLGTQAIIGETPASAPASVNYDALALGDLTRTTTVKLDVTAPTLERGSLILAQRVTKGASVEKTSSQLTVNSATRFLRDPVNAGGWLYWNLGQPSKQTMRLEYRLSSRDAVQGDTGYALILAVPASGKATIQGSSYLGASVGNANPVLLQGSRDALAPLVIAGAQVDPNAVAQPFGQYASINLDATASLNPESGAFTLAATLGAYATLDLGSDFYTQLALSGSAGLENGNIVGAMAAAQNADPRFAVTGDSSLSSNLAPSSLYAEIGNRQFSIAYGGTSATLATPFGAINSTGTNIVGRFNEGGFAVQAFATPGASATRSTTSDLPGGSLISAPDTGLLENSETVTVLLVNSSAGAPVTLSETVLRRGTDYRIDYATGIIVLSTPLPNAPLGQMYRVRVAYALTNDPIALNFAFGGAASYSGGGISASLSAAQLSSSGPLFASASVGYRDEDINLSVGAATSGGIAIAADAGFKTGGFTFAASLRDSAPDFLMPGQLTNSEAGRRLQVGLGLNLGGGFTAQATVAQRMNYSSGAVENSATVGTRAEFGFVSAIAGFAGVFPEGSASATPPSLYAVAGSELKLGFGTVTVLQRIPVSGGNGQTSLEAVLPLAENITARVGTVLDYLPSGVSFGVTAGVRATAQISNPFFLDSSFEATPVTGAISADVKQTNTALTGTAAISASVPLSQNVAANASLSLTSSSNAALAGALGLGVKAEGDGYKLGAGLAYTASATGNVRASYNSSGALNLAPGTGLSAAAEYATIDARDGTRFSVGAAYRVSSFTTLLSIASKSGVFTSDAQGEFSGQIAVAYVPSQYFTATAGAGAKLTSNATTIQFGISSTYFITDFLGFGGQLTYQTSSLDASYISAGLEAAFKLAPGFVTALGYNFVGYQSIGFYSANPGIYLRFSIALDERSLGLR